MEFVVSDDGCRHRQAAEDEQKEEVMGSDRTDVHVVQELRRAQ